MNADRLLLAVTIASITVAAIFALVAAVR